jgi:mono/diheme cytochrome c family protein
VQKDAALKARLVRWSALWIVPSLAVVPLAGWWYIRSIPATVWASARGPMPTGTLYAELAVVLLSATFVLALVTLARPGRLHLAFSLLMALVALGTMGAFEFVRESIRDPYVIANYLYANSIYSNPTPGDGGFDMDTLDSAGVLETAKWVDIRTVTSGNQIAAGREIFRVDCESCHTANSYRGLKHYLALRQWDASKIQAMLGGLDLMHNGVMPPFAGSDAERGALAAYLSTLAPATVAAAADGKTVFERDCGMCHRVSASDPLFANLAKDPQAANEALKDLPSLFPLMPDLKLSDQERAMLVGWLNTQRSGQGSAAAGQDPGAAVQGGN